MSIFQKLSLSILFISAVGFSSCNRCKASGDGEDCVCIEIYAPVCGCDGKTYGNSCHAECAGIEDYEEGKCLL